MMLERDTPSMPLSNLRLAGETAAALVAHAKRGGGFPVSCVQFSQEPHDVWQDQVTSEECFIMLESG
jgi:hypothetical protein